MQKDGATAEYSETESSPDETCGIGRFKPRWLQRFADPKVYLIIFCIVGVIEGAYYTYFIGVLSTLEKRFAFESKTSGIILIADNFSAAVISLVVGYYGGKCHKPRMMAFGMILVCFSSFLSALPYFMYGPATHFLSRDSPVLGNKQKEYCSSVENEDDCGGDKNSEMFPAVLLLFTANFINGFGYTAYYTIGTPYLDDNVKKKNSPMYLSAMGSLRVFGPALGFFLASVCLNFYEDPFYDPGIDPDNPRWVGAWWMGFLILGFILFVFTLLLALFPRRLPQRFRSEKEVEVDTQDAKDNTLPKLKDFPKEIKRLFKNPILVCLVISSIFQVNGFMGYFIFMPKYMESQYQKSASDASLFSGATGIVFMLAGILLGGMVIMKYKPRPRYLTGYMVIAEVFSVLGFFIFIFLGCPPLQMPGTHLKSDETLNLYNECNAGCGCTLRVFEPVCAENGITTFFSPCFAGCPNSTGYSTSAIVTTTTSSVSSNKTIFENCMCASGVNNTLGTSATTSGFCSSVCNMFIIYIIVLCISKFISSTARVGNTLITFRCVDAKDKSFALGAFGSILALFAFLPGPLIYGAIIDSTCLVWEEKCLKTGNCWLYDSDKFRHYLHGVTILLITIGVSCDVVVFFYSDRLVNFYGEDEEKEVEGDGIVEVLAEEHMKFTKSPKRSSLVRMDSWL